MYIPISFFGGTNCTGSGFCYSYGNTSTSSADAITYTSLCGVSGTPLTISPNRVEQFAAVSASVGGLAATTKLAGQPYTVSSSCRFFQPTIYTLTKFGATLGTDGYFMQEDINDVPSTRFYGSGVAAGSTISVLSLFPPQLTYRTAQGGGYTTITNAAPSGSPVLDTNDWNNGTVRKWQFTMMSGSFSINTSLYGKPIIRDVVIPVQLNNSPGLRYEMLSETTPYIQYTTPITTNRYLGWNYGPEGGAIQNVSSSNWNYSIYNPDASSYTINYVNCSNVSASIVVGSGATERFCARYNSIVFPSLPVDGDLSITLDTPADISPVPLPSGSIPVSQSIWSAIDLAYSNYSTASYIISDLSGNQHDLNQTTSSWNFTTTSSVSGSIFDTQNTIIQPFTWDDAFPVPAAYTFLVAWRSSFINPSDYKFPILGRGDETEMYGFENNIYDLSNLPSSTPNQCGTNGATLNTWHITQISVNNVNRSGSFCIDGITGSMVNPAGFGNTFIPILFGQNRVFGGTLTGSFQWQVAAMYTGSLSNDQMVTNWNALKGRYGY
jgi:hypothetical protein